MLSERQQLEKVQYRFPNSKSLRKPQINMAYSALAQYSKFFGMHIFEVFWPKLYSGITLLFTDPKKRFPEEFDPQCPYHKLQPNKVSREGLIKLIYGRSGETLVPLEDFHYEPPTLWEETPQDVDLRDGATYIVVSSKEAAYRETVSCFALHVALP